MQYGFRDARHCTGRRPRPQMRASGPRSGIERTLCARSEPFRLFPIQTSASQGLTGRLLMFSTISSVLKEKGKSRLVSTAPSATVIDTVQAMNDENVGAVLVMDGQ